MPLRDVSLLDKYTADSGRVFLTGTQALVRLPLIQKRIDAARGFRTAGYISGYRGSPLGGYDQQLAAASKLLEQHDIRFNPGVNEELAATACWGTQQAQLRGDGKFDGVFAIWYGKGPGVDRSGDAFKHGNLAGTSPLGGVIALLGDDHTCESSTTAHQSEFALVDAMMPILNPAGLEDLIDYGLYGWALSRYSGCWIGIKCVKDTVDASGTLDVAFDPWRLKIPQDFPMPEGGVNIRYPDPPLEQEARLHRVKLEAAKAFARTNPIDRVTHDSPDAVLGIVTCGKSYLDVRQALQTLGIDDADAARSRIRVLKVGMVWPLDAANAVAFARGLRRIVVVEEKRALLEPQVKEALYGLEHAPVVEGKRDERGAVLFPSNGALDPNDIAIAIGERILQGVDDARLRERLAKLASLRSRMRVAPALERTPYFCSGCPHNTGTKVPEGSRAMAGIGCHYMAQWMDRSTNGYTQMGGEGASWVGMAPFVETPHIFQNIGDGTYVHSGSLAIRAAIASGVNLTYRILFNDAVAMTGGQRPEGGLTVPQIAAQMLAEGAAKVAVVSDDPEKYAKGSPLPSGVTAHHRHDYLAVQREFRRVQGVGVIIYDQTCAAEKRRRRKRGTEAEPPRRVFINDLVCEGCGDCGVESNCVSVTPLETEFGRKRAIDQSACNRDFSCLKGFCPSFVSVIGGGLRKSTGGSIDDASFPALPDPVLPPLDEPYGMLITGIGGTGIVTLGAILGMAAHLEGKAFRGLDMAGLAQKGGAVWSHAQIASTPGNLHTARLAAGSAKLVLGCDLVAAASAKTLEVAGTQTYVVVNTHRTMTGDFARNASFDFPADALRTAILRVVGEDHARFVDASRIATKLLGDSIATNMFLLGFAYQLGRIPLGADSINRAIEINGASVELNQAAFAWGRRAAADPIAVEERIASQPDARSSTRLSQSLDEVIARRIAFLTDYQDAAWADRYRRLVEKVRAAPASSRHAALTDAVARNFFKLMAYKDEYEVARLYTQGDFLERLGQQLEGDVRLRFHLAPPLWSRRDPETGRLVKREYGAWVLPAFRLLAKLKGLRGTRWDPFGYTAERKAERALIDDYESTIGTLVETLDDVDADVVLGIARIPEDIRGFGHVKTQGIAAAMRKKAALLAQLRSPARAGEQATTPTDDAAVAVR